MAYPFIKIERFIDYLNLSGGQSGGKADEDSKKNCSTELHCFGERRNLIFRSLIVDERSCIKFSMRFGNGILVVGNSFLFIDDVVSKLSAKGWTFVRAEK